MFECVGMNASVVDPWFTGTVSRIGGADIHTPGPGKSKPAAQASKPCRKTICQPVGGRYKWRRDGESHQYNPDTVPLLQQAVRRSDRDAWKRYRGSRLPTQPKRGVDPRIADL